MDKNQEIQEININVENGIKELVIRKGDAAPIKEPVKLIVENVSFDSLIEFVEKGETNEVFDKQKSVAIINTGLGIIEFRSNYKDIDSENIKARLVPSEYLQRFNINKNKSFTRKDIYKLIQFNNRFIDSPDWRDILVKIQSVKLTQEKKIEHNLKDQRGNQKASVEVQNSIDFIDEFILNIPIFQNQEPSKFTVQVLLDAVDNDIAFWLESPALEEIIQMTIENTLTEYANKLKELGITCLMV